jgi:hypothetical protein
MPEDTYAQQRQQICAILWLVRPVNMETLYMVSELIATGKRTLPSPSLGGLCCRIPLTMLLEIVDCILLLC